MPKEGQYALPKHAAEEQSKTMAPTESAQKGDPFLTHPLKEVCVGVCWGGRQGEGSYLSLLLILIRHQSLAAVPKDTYNSSGLIYLE